MRVVISSGHGKYVRGAVGIIDEVDEARKVVEAVADELEAADVDTETFHDNSSRDQGENLETIVAFHNAKTRDLDVSIHFNAYKDTPNPMGTEVLYVTDKQKAIDVVNSIAKAGFINRGPKYRDDLYFLNCTEEPAILIEVCFVDSEADVDIYQSHFNDICALIADGIMKGEVTS